MAGAAGGFVTRAFEAMLKECTANRGKFAALQQSIQSYLDAIKGAAAGQEPRQQEEGVAAAPITQVLASAGRVLEGTQAELVLQPLRLAFETKHIKLVEPALDCLHKLIAYDHLEGDPGLEGGKNSPLFTDILNMVCGCVDNTSSDSTVLQVLKVLLNAVASNRFRVHGEPLLGVIRVCYNIALNSKSPVNQATSKAMLTQMISIVFRRMESEQVSVPPPSFKDAPSPSTKASENGEVPTDNQDGEKITLGDALSMNRASEGSPTSVEELQNLAGGADIKGLEAVLDKAVELEDGKKVSGGIDLDTVNIIQRDALLLFRTLCKMSMKDESDEVATKTRLLSLELLQGLLEGVSDSFTKNFHFIDSVKAYLSYAILRASVSSSPVVFQYACGIFAVLLLRFRESLKVKLSLIKFTLWIYCLQYWISSSIVTISVLSNIYAGGNWCLLSSYSLRSLDSSDSPLSQRASVLRMLEKVCKDSQMLADMFVNYDCDFEGPNLFERAVSALSRIAQGSQSTDTNTAGSSQTVSIKGSSLQCLVSILKSLVDWEQARRDSSKQGSIAEAHEEDSSVRSLTADEIKGQEDGRNQFERAKAHKSTMEAAISEFNRKPAKGIEYLLSNKLIENNATSVAHFLKSNSSLHKVMIGEYLGQHEEFPLAVMHAYVDSMKFSGLKFDAAIREFLKGFRLPGEAQKIDRIMEKFAERYCADNPGLFKNADTAYVLAYAVIMLNTDAHNPMVWPKMSKSDFVRMNTVSDAEECAPKELLEEIYDSIVKEEIKMKDDFPDAAKTNKLRRETEERGLVNILNLALPRLKSAGDTKAESEKIIKQTQALFKNQGQKRGVFHVAQQVELVRPMLEAVGWPLLATFSVTMEEGDSKPRVVLCMEGFRAGIHLTRVLGMDTMRYAFLTSLVRFTFLHAPKEMRSKNVEALRTLLALADTDMDALQDTWNAVLECVSRLEYITSNPSIAATVMLGSNQISRDSVVQSLKELSGKPSEQVFVNSVKLPSDSIVEFFTALCGVSAEELKQTPARVFSLQKLVEISYYNMARIRLVWARIWSVLSQHFIAAGSHQEEKVAMYAIDSLRQLGMKYLERAELNKFTFQNDILKPFVILMRNSRSEKIRGLIVDCIVQLIKSKVGSIKSGWRCVFMIFTAAADDENEYIVESAFENVEQVILEHFDQVVGDCFMDCVNCLIGFANNKCTPRISLKAIALLRICEDRLAEGCIPGGAVKPVDVVPEANFDVTEHYWHSGRDGLSTGDDWLRDTSIHSLQLICNLFNTFYKEVSFMLPPLLGLLLGCAKKTDQTVVSIALGALVHLIEVGGHQFSDDDWEALLKSIRDASYTTQPLELLNSLGFQKSNNQQLLSREAETDALGSSYHDIREGVSVSKNGEHDGHQETNPQTSLDNSEGLPSPSGTAQPVVSPRGQTFGQRFMGNMMDNLLVRSLTSKSKGRTDDIAPPSAVKAPDADEAGKAEEEEENPMMETVRSKCITQLLLLGAIDSIQKRYWSRLKTTQQIAIMDILLSLLEFASSYNSPSNLRTRMHHIPLERPPLNLLRQELAGTTIYLDILHKSTVRHDGNGSNEETNDYGVESDEHENLKNLAEGKLISFCGQILKDASDLQPSTGEAASADIHRVLDLRAPVIVKVLNGMCIMDAQIFKKHIREFYPLITKLICCDQMDVRGALGDLFSKQLTPLMP
ncbi:hypothetical protein GUJ93_ZPchr0007g4420 [Zizania palustris]|uniref:SEC7 domain-containing protein n=1 Tax=Zizania palustris TaxID=103762 RepID=A0A8J5T5L6_ZIZPA|nr:hypothetical protein GUJ93_ZPchr0007g4420 [Zizania palustris]